MNSDPSPGPLADLTPLVDALVAARVEVRRRGTRLLVHPASNCPPALVAMIKAAKGRLLALLPDELVSVDASGSPHPVSDPVVQRGCDPVVQRSKVVVVRRPEDLLVALPGLPQATLAALATFMVPRTDGEATGTPPPDDGAGLPPDERPWLPIARNVLAGDHDVAEFPSEIETLVIGLRSVRHPDSQAAVGRLKALLPEVRKRADRARAREARERRRSSP